MIIHGLLCRPEIVWLFVKFNLVVDADQIAITGNLLINLLLQILQTLFMFFAHLGKLVKFLPFLVVGIVFQFFFDIGHQFLF